MPFRPVQSFSDAVEIVRRADRPNAHILVDALHFFRSASSLEDLACADPAMLGTFQICDAPQLAPAPEDLVTEARTRRLLPGEGGLPLRSLINGLPPGIPFGIEVPLASQFPTLDPTVRAALLVDSTRRFLERITA
jgi:sugar phosphate isomerase/epimerase